MPLNEGAEATTVATNASGAVTPIAAKSVLLAPSGTSKMRLVKRTAGPGGLVERVRLTEPLKPFIELRIRDPIPSDPVFR